METLTEIVQESKEIQKEIKKIKLSGVNNYIIELIRISEMYEFKLDIKPRIVKQVELPPPEKHKGDIKEVSIVVEEEKSDFKQYLNIQTHVENVSYEKLEIKVDYSKYNKKKPIRIQELWQKEGFYQEKTTQSRVKVQLWPEHLPYDDFKRKRAFLFC